jgi:hypothetical protein
MCSPENMEALRVGMQPKAVCTEGITWVENVSTLNLKNTSQWSETAAVRNVCSAQIFRTWQGKESSISSVGRREKWNIPHYMVHGFQTGLLMNRICVDGQENFHTTIMREVPTEGKLPFN